MAAAMPFNDHRPQMWKLDGAAAAISAGAVAALCLVFLVVSLIRSYGAPAMAFGGLGALVMAVLALGYWRGMRRRAERPRR